MKKFAVVAALAVASLACGTAFAQGKPAIGVAEFKNESGAAWWRGGVGWELSGMLSNELSSTGSFRVVERAKLEKVLEEQNLAASGRVRSGTGAKMGQVTGADYLGTAGLTPNLWLSAHPTFLATTKVVAVVIQVASIPGEQTPLRHVSPAAHA